jgi:hypothetical protein
MRFGHTSGGDVHRESPQRRLSLRPLVSRAHLVIATLLVLLASLCLSQPARAQVTTDQPDFFMPSGPANYWPAAFTQTYFATSPHAGWTLQFRWLDNPNYPTVMSTNHCGDMSPIAIVSFPAGLGGTNYHAMGAGPYIGACIRLGGRVANGYPALHNHDGRFKR